MGPLTHHLKYKVKKHSQNKKRLVLYAKDGSMRITVDSTPLNKVIKQDTYSLKKNMAQLIIIKHRRVTTHLAGPFKVTIRGNKYYMVIICCFTKYIRVYALTNIQAEAISDKLVNRWCCTFSLLETILADGGK